MKVFVAGNLGYIGSVATEVLWNAGYSIVGCDAELYEGNTIESATQLKKNIKDVTPSDLAGVDVVVDYANIPSDQKKELPEGFTTEMNYGSAKLAAIAKKAGVERYIFSSSTSVYEGLGDEQERDERSPVYPPSEYGQTKLRVEQAAKMLACKTFHPIILRNSTAFGWSPMIRLDLMVNQFAAMAYTKKEIVLGLSPIATRPSIHVRDSVDAVQKAIEGDLENVSTQTFNIGMQSETMSVFNVASIVQEEFRGCSIRIPPGAMPDQRSYRINFNKAKDLLKFEAKRSIKYGVGELKAMFDEVGLTVFDFEDSSHLRMRCLKKAALAKATK